MLFGEKTGRGGTSDERSFEIGKENEGDSIRERLASPLIDHITNKTIYLWIIKVGPSVSISSRSLILDKVF